MKILISHCNEIPSCHCEELETHVPLHVEGEVVGPAEGPLAQLALEGFITGVFPGNRVIGYMNKNCIDTLNNWYQRDFHSHSHTSCVC